MWSKLSRIYPRFTFVWASDKGPPVDAPQRLGFGMHAGHTRVAAVASPMSHVSDGAPPEAVPWAQPRLTMVSRRPSVQSRVHVAVRSWLGLAVPAPEMDLRRMQAEEFGITFGVPTGDAAILKVGRPTRLLDP